MPEVKTAPKEIHVLVIGGDVAQAHANIDNVRQIRSDVFDHHLDLWDADFKETRGDKPRAKDYTVEPYVHASELEAVQARLDRIIALIEKDYHLTIELKAAIAAAKGE